MNSKLNLNPTTSTRLQELIRLARMKKELALPLNPETAKLTTPEILQEATSPANEVSKVVNDLQESESKNLIPNSGELIIPSGVRIFNQKQQEAINLAKTFSSFTLIGAAGTGKTTVVREIAKLLSQRSEMTLIESDSKVFKQNQAGIICVSFTNIAVQNIASQMEGAVTCSTIHNLIEFKPEYLEEVNPETGSMITKRIFLPFRNRHNPLPNGIKTIIIEESGVVGTRLFNLLLEALPNPESINFIFLGDLYQLPPVFDNPILGHKLLELPIIELTEVYRQALNSPILALAHKIKDGKQLPEIQLKELNHSSSFGTLAVKTFQKRTEADSALILFESFMRTLILKQDSYNPADTMILIPYNVNFGCIEGNKIISSILDTKRFTEGDTNPIYEVIAGYNKLYLSVGDIIYSRKRKARIAKITKNGRYLGKMPATASVTLNRWGIDDSVDLHAHLNHKQESDLDTLRQVDSMLASLDSDEDTRKTAASHIIDIEFISSDSDIDSSSETLDSASELNELIGGYCLTVHKAQGSEWDNGICWFHNSHARFINRELLYTAVTRFKKSLLIICEKDTFIRGINNQALKGTTLQDKLESLKLKLKEAETMKFN